MKKQEIFAPEVDYQLPAPFPPECASAWGEDTCGLWFACNYQGVEQRFRWVWPGRFWMGSPVDEKGRSWDETPHVVILTQGLWLAETACSQGLWWAVMGENPSDFKDDMLPVEGVSWDDAREFIVRLNTLRPGLELRLPSEAEWEYACRAGTTTPFSFGYDITPEQVNYNGNYPYAGHNKGLYRQKTVAVGSLTANPWGLYEMHGNVWEWCADLYGVYPPGPVRNPPGPGLGDERVLRGGGLISHGRDVRSAYRFRFEPSLSSLNMGFRLARGQ